MKLEKQIILVFVFMLVVSMMPVNHGTASPTSPIKPNWGWPMHYEIIDTAIAALPTEWNATFRNLYTQIKGGSILPDTWGDWMNHLYYPTEVDHGNGTAPQAIKSYFEYMVNNLSTGDYPAAMLAAGVLSHYTADISIATHTGPLWGGDITSNGHTQIEASINAQIAQFTIGSLTAIDTLTKDNIVSAASEWATAANVYYNLCKQAYPDNTTANTVVITNTTLKAAINDMLTLSTGHVLSVWLSAIKQAGFIPPTLHDVAITKKAWIDTGHSNDYATQLISYGNYLKSFGYNVVYDSDKLQAGDLDGVSVVIITAIYDGGAYTPAELAILSTWANTNQSKVIIVTGRGDYQTIDHAAINNVLTAVGSTIFMNDDNVYTAAPDPKFYKSHYVYTTNITLPDNAPLPSGFTYYHEYSPNSVIFNASSIGEVLAYGVQWNYQSDLNAPAPAVIYDDTNDGVGGERIPLLTLQENSNTSTKIVVAGATDFSDYNFAISGQHNDYEYWQAFTKILLGVTDAVQVFGPTIKLLDISSITSTTCAVNFQISANVKYMQLYVNHVFKSNFTSFVANNNSITIPINKEKVEYLLILYTPYFILNVTFTDWLYSLLPEITETSSTEPPAITPFTLTPIGILALCVSITIYRRFSKKRY